RTTLHAPQHQGQAIDVFRVVLANPLTDLAILAQILDEQRALASGEAVAARLAACLATFGLPATRPLQSRAFPASG
ncbi:MAG TPA: hypothetical protein PKZ77_02735, partial [Pseudomonadales bacterium]|nr:hypothetical protein [Pseudomonadales bacterium]